MLRCFLFSFLAPRCRAVPPLFPYTTLFRSATAPGRWAGCGAGVDIGGQAGRGEPVHGQSGGLHPVGDLLGGAVLGRSEEHTSELQSRGHLVCRLLLEKKNGPSEPRGQTSKT